MEFSLLLFLCNVSHKRETIKPCSREAYLRNNKKSGLGKARTFILYPSIQDINTIISLNDKIIYSGFIKAYELPRLLEKRNMKIGFYKVSAKLNNVLIEQRFFYFLQKTIWIDFDCANSNSLLISKYYRQIPL